MAETIELPSKFIKEMLKDFITDCVPSEGKPEYHWRLIEMDLREMMAKGGVQAPLTETIVFWARQIWDEYDV